jgi:tetratricopeptide (TPR) repeat protein
MRKLFVSTLCLAAVCTALPGKLHATGDFGPDRWLSNGGMASDMSPEFYWEIELKRMAKEFTPQEKRVLPLAPKPEPRQMPLGTSAVLDRFTTSVDEAEFDDAIKTGRVKVADVDKAKEAHKTARELATGGHPIPDEVPSEFADYHRGASAMHDGAGQYAEAHKAWEGLLKRPESERHYRSVWAVFMLGKLALAEEDYPEAVKRFRETRELAKAGFADAIGLAADSYGWEGRAELRQQHYEAAAKLYLTQLSLGDESAIVSLKAVIPDRVDVEGMLNFDQQPSEEELKKAEESGESVLQKGLDECARSTVLRHLVTAHVLATETQAASWSYGGESTGDESAKPGERCRRWLATVEKAGLKQLDDADHLGWVAYTAGRYKDAARWLAVAKADSPTALWLKAKLERRDGKLAQAAATMDAAFKSIMRQESPPFGDSMFVGYDAHGYGLEQSAAGDLAGLHLTRGEFVAAMETFLQGVLWSDAAFVADRVLTVEELKKYVDAHFPESAIHRNPDGVLMENDASRMRWMLARRLVRQHRFDEARAYFPNKKERETMGRYAAALKQADDSKLPKPQRARALFTAGWIARHDGLEIMGTEVEPDGFISEGEVSSGDLDTERLESVHISLVYDDKKERDVQKKKPVKLSIPASAAEKQRIAANSPHPTRRFHYRWVAADLAWRAAELMGDGTEELADVLNTGGAWIKDRDEKGADKFIQAIERRCPRTEIGKAESVKHWFVGDGGPWSDALQKEDEARQQADTPKPQ